MTDERADSPDTFAAWLRERAAECGYGVDTPRSGGMQRLAADSGVNLPQLSRLLAGKVDRPSNDTLKGLAGPLHATLGEMLLRSGQATREELPIAAAPVDPLDARIEEFVHGLPPAIAKAFRERAAEIRRQADEQTERQLRAMAEIARLADGTSGES